MEIWRKIPGWENYEASSLGRIRSIDRKDTIGRRVRGKVRALTPNEKGYLQVQVSKDGKKFSRKVHALVCAAFHGARPDGDIVTRHLDGNQLNNVPTNLAWGTRSENNYDRYAHANARKAQTHG